MNNLSRFFLIFFLCLGFVAKAESPVNTNRPLQKYKGHVSVFKDQKLIRFATYDRVYFLKFPPVAARNQFQLRDVKPDKEIVLEFLDAEIDHIESLTAEDKKTWK